MRGRTKSGRWRRKRTDAKRSKRRWSIHEDLFLENNGEKTDHDIAKELGRTPIAVKQRRRKLGLHRQVKATGF